MATNPAVVAELNKRRQDATASGTGYSDNKYLRSYDAFANSGVGRSITNPSSTVTVDNTTPPSVLTGQPKMPPDNPTTLYSGNVETKYIPDQKSRLNKLSEKGLYNDQNGNGYYPNGDLMMDDTVDESELMQNPSYKLLSDLRRKTDATTDTYIASIQNSTRNAINAQKAQNAADQNTVQNTLLRYGASRTGSGAMARGAVSTAGLQAISDLEAKEQQTIAEARQAQMNGDFKIAEDKIGIAEDLRKEKQKRVKSANDAVQQASRDSAIAGLITQGVTDPTQLLDFLNFDDQGNPTGDFTLKEISDALAAVKKNTGIDNLEDLSADLKDFFVLKQNGLLPEGISSLPEEKQLFAFTQAKSAARKVSSKSSSVGKSVKSGSATFSGEDVAQGAAMLEASRGDDGYVDPTVYQRLSETWIEDGGLIQDFIKTYPPKQYVNPVNGWLPPYLMPGGKRGGSTTVNTPSTSSSGVSFDDL